MAQTKTLKPSAPWVELTTTQSDWDDADPQLLLSMFAELSIVRAFEEYVLELAGQKLIHGPAHSSIGQEGGAVGSVIALGPGDQVNGSHRGHHQFLAKAIQYVQPQGFDPRTDLNKEVREVLYRSLSEIAGLAAGYCNGRGGSMHLQWIEAGAMGTNAIVGGAVPFATGFGWADRMAGTDNVAVTYFGDGAVNIGSVLESFNLASAWQIPVCFFIENNQYAVSTTVDEATGEHRLSGRGLGFGIPSWRVDGQDTLAVHLAMREAVEHMRSGAGPTIIEADTYRYFHQNGPFPGSAFGYRSKDEEESWRARDPLALVGNHLVRREVLTSDEVQVTRTRTREAMREVGDLIVEADPDGKPGQLRIREQLWPSTDFIDVGIRGEAPTAVQLSAREEDSFSEDELVEMKFVDAVASVMHRRMEVDDSVVVLGEDVHRLNGGSRGATKGLADDFPGRVLGTPISECAFTGFGGGLALDGRYYPVVELMYADFIWVAADQLFNQIAKARHMFGGEHDMPLLLRIKVGTGTGYGSQHSMDPAGILASSVGWRVIAPSTPLDYVGLVNTAMRLRDPVAVLEHDADLYRSVGQVPKDLDFCLPFGQAAVRREGDAVTVISYLSMVERSLQAVAEAQVDAEVIDLRWLDRASVDWSTLETSIEKTNRVVIVEQGSIGPSYGGWLSDEIQRRYFDWLDAPVERVTGAESAPSISRVLETAALAGTDDIVMTLRGLA